MKLLYFIVTTAFLVAGHEASGQSLIPVPLADRPIPLEVSQTVKAQIQGTFFGRVKCNDDGEIYLRPYSAEKNKNHTLHQTPIQKLKADGTLDHAYSNPDAQPDWWGMDFFVSPSGEVFQVGINEKSLAIYLIDFFPDGSVKSTTQIAAEAFHPYQMAVFKSGQILLSGIKGEQGRTPFTAVFTSTGKMIKEVVDKNDKELEKRASGEEPVPGFQKSSFGNRAVQFGEAISGSDGNVYLLRSGSPALVYAVSPHGDVVRKFTVDAGDPELMAVSMKAAPGQLAVAFGRQNEGGTFVQVTDLEGHSVASYGTNDGRLTAQFLSCYVSHALVFTTRNSDGFVEFNKAEGK